MVWSKRNGATLLAGLARVASLTCVGAWLIANKPRRVRQAWRRRRQYHSRSTSPVSLPKRP